MQTLQFPYWAQSRVFPTRFELNLPRNLDIWRHHNQEKKDAIRPNGHQILSALEMSGLMHRIIGLKTLLFYKANRDLIPSGFGDIYIFGWMDTVFGPYAGRQFVPALTPSNHIQWVDLETGLNCLDATPLVTRS